MKIVIAISLLFRLEVYARLLPPHQTPYLIATANTYT